MTRVALMRAAGIRPLWSFLQCAGAPVGRIVTRVRLPSYVLAEPETLIPVHLMARFLTEAACSEGIPHLGALAGQAVGVTALGVFGNVVLRSGTLREAIRTAQRMGPSYSSGEMCWLTESSADEMTLCHRFTTRLDEGLDQAEQYSLMIMIRALRGIAGPEWRPTVHFRKGVSRSIADVELLDGADLAFDRPVSAIVFPSTLLDVPLAREGRRRPEPADRVARWIASRPAPDLVGSVRQVIATLLPIEGLGIDDVAEIAGPSTRTLQRRLTATGTTYRRLVGQARFETACGLLETDSIALADVARRVGYATLTQFDHAFRRWTGTTPRDFRRLRRDDAAPSASVAARESMRDTAAAM